MSRRVKRIRFSGIVTRNDQGFVARAVELPLTNGYNGAFQGKTQREGVKRLKKAAAQWLGWRADDGTLAKVLDDLGFRGAIGSDTTEAHVYSTPEIELPLPRNWLRKKEGDSEREGEHASR